MNNNNNNFISGALNPENIVIVSKSEARLSKSLATKYPQIAEAANYLIPLISKTRDLLNNKNSAPTNKNINFELEARFGKIYVGAGDKKKFQNGTDRKFMDRVLQDFEKFSGWHSVNDWEEQHDFYYDFNGQNIRTTVNFDMLSKSTIPTHISKTVIDRNDFTYSCPETSSNNLGYDIRVALAQEQHFDVEQLPTYVKPTCVRIKQRKSFIYKSASSSGTTHLPAWSFDFTCSWIGATKEEAQKKQQLDDKRPIYEIELECLNPKQYFNAPGHTDAYIALSLFLKLRDIYGPATTNNIFTLQPPHTQ